jgi:hypothetical protein
MNNWEGKSIQIVAFAVPYPPNYGGVIDVFYKIKAIAALGVKIHLHAYTYGEHLPAPLLNHYCASVTYYPRSLTSKYLQGWPYIVASRYNKLLADNLVRNGSPVLLEGLHVAYLIPFLKAAGIPHVLRLHNVEWKYYKLLADGERSFARKKYFLEESKRLKLYEQNLVQTPLLSLSPVDTDYVHAHFPGTPVKEVLPFHEFQGLEVLEGVGKYALFHGNLSVNENEIAALWLVQQVFSKLHYPLIITGKSPSKSLEMAVGAYSHIRLIPNPMAEEMKNLQQMAQFHLLPNSQPTGMKLKWAHALHTGRYILAHPDMSASHHGKGGVLACVNPEEYINAINLLKARPFNQAVCEERLAILGAGWINSANASAVLSAILP